MMRDNADFDIIFVKKRRGVFISDSARCQKESSPQRLRRLQSVVRWPADSLAPLLPLAATKVGGDEAKKCFFILNQLLAIVKWQAR